jgi:hypothetical protein
MTVAMSMLIHGEAVRFNRGQAKTDDFDFKYMKGRDGSVFPYVSSQCYKKYWRESLAGPFSPIIREKGAGGKEKNQAFTDGNPIDYVDDDLFGYMVAGATETDDDAAGTETPEGGGDAPRVFEAENIKDPEALKTKLLDDSPLSKFILGTVPDTKERLQGPPPPDDLLETLLNLLDEAARKPGLFETEGIKGVKTKHKRLRAGAELHDAAREVLLRTFAKELQEKPKRDTTRRTAPVRMHALVAFSGIRTAKDFQTFSRDIAYTPGANSVMNPAPPGIYSGWLKTRILIESQRIGKFYVGKNMDILKKQVGDRETLTEANPYSKEAIQVEYVQLDDPERTNRLRAALRALANIGNRQGPASGALHDGSLRPKAFVAGFLNCADSPFDYIWTARNDDSMPELDVNLLRNSINDWKDLFETKKIYVGLPTGADLAMGELAATTGQTPAWEMRLTLETELKKIGFEAVVDTPRRALLRLAEEATP